MVWQNIPYNSDEFKLENSSPSWAELWRFWVESSWGTSIFELKPSWQYQQYVCKKLANFYSYLTRLTWLIHTSVLPSSWNPDKIFAPTGLLGQVHIVKKIFLKFLHAGSWSFLLLNLWFSSKLVSKMNFKKMASAWKHFKNIFLPYVLDLIDLMEQKFYRDTSLRVKLTYASVSQDLLNSWNFPK